MAITQERIIRLLTAAEDLRDALRQAGEFVREATTRARAPGGNALAELETLEARLAPELLLRDPLGAMMALEREREHWSEGRLERNTAKRLKRQQHQQDY